MGYIRNRLLQMLREKLILTVHSLANYAKKFPEAKWIRRCKFKYKLLIETVKNESQAYGNMKNVLDFFDSIHVDNFTIEIDRFSISINN